MWREFETTRHRTRFNEQATAIVDRIDDKLFDFRLILHGAAALFAASEEVSRADWSVFVRHQELFFNYPEIQSVRYSPYIPAGMIQDHVHDVRAEGFPEYNVWPRGERDVYAPVLYVEPFSDANRAELGYDALVHHSNRLAMEEARDTADTRMTRVITLVPRHDRGLSSGFVLYAPVYRKGVPPESIENRREDVKGFASVSFRFGEFVHELSSDPASDLVFDIYDGANTASAEIVFSGSPEAATEPLFTTTITRDFFGREWSLVFRSTSAFDIAINRWTSRVILFAGAIVSILVFLLLRAQRKMLDRANEIARRLTSSLRENEERFRLITENIDAVVWLTTEDNSRVVYVTPSYETVFGRAREDLYDHPHDFLHAVHPDDRSSVRAALQTNLADRWIDSTYRVVRPDGNVRWVDVQAYPVYDEHGTVIAHLARAIDATDRYVAEEDRIAREAAEQANRTKSAFLAAMSHEIRTPLNAILGFAQLLERDSSLTDRPREYVHVITRSGQHLLDLINDILDISRIESGRLNFNVSDFSLHDLLEDLRMMFRSRAEAKGLHLVLETQATVPRFIRSDEGKLRQILVNLLGNAVKFTASGGVAIRVRASGDNDEAPRLEVEVEDTGPGISPEDVEQIFETFRQSEAGLQTGGTGLGLAISRRLVEMLGGTISVTSSPGIGSVFRFHVPVERAEEFALAPPTDVRRVTGLEDGDIERRILVADDQKDNSDLLVALLEPAGFRVKVAENGADALELFREWKPHAVLMDLRMPVMDGYEATRRIKSTEEGSRIPVIAVTASIFEGDADTIFQAGVDGYLRKPFRPEELFEILKEYLDVTYVYEDSTSGNRTYGAGVGNAWTLGPDDLDPLPDDVILEMLRAVEDGDMFAFKNLLVLVERKDVEIAGRLRVLADAFDYVKLRNVLGNRENRDE